VHITNFCDICNRIRSWVDVFQLCAYRWVSKCKILLQTVNCILASVLWHDNCLYLTYICEGVSDIFCYRGTEVHSDSRWCSRSVSRNQSAWSQRSASSSVWLSIIYHRHCHLTVTCCRQLSQSAIIDESDRTEDNRLTLQHTCAQSQKWIMGVCFVNDTVFLVRSDSSTIWVIPWRGFYWQSHCAIEDWLAFGHSCISSSQLSVCRSQPVHTTALCWFGICHPHGVVYAKMAGGDCDS